VHAAHLLRRYAALVIVHPARRIVGHATKKSTLTIGCQASQIPMLTIAMWMTGVLHVVDRSVAVDGAITPGRVVQVSAASA